VAICIGCAVTNKSTREFALPVGDVEQGKVAFQTLRCYTCHRVEGADFPAPVATPPVPVVLGGKVKQIPSRLELANSIINPSHEFAPGHKDELIKSGKLSRMGDYSDVLTVQQLSDLVAFLQSRYTTE
jgi:L-cysteine S-thiosulfotransferase